MTNKWLDEYKTAEKIVRKVLRENSDTRADDRKLMLKVWNIQGLKLNYEQTSLFMKVLPMETITRARRKIQENGEYRPIKEVYEQRQILDGQVGNYMRED